MLESVMLNNEMQGLEAFAREISMIESMKAKNAKKWK
jgi:hypothetical protein